VLQGAFAAGAVLLGARRAFAAGDARASTVRLGYVGNPCEAVTFAAPGNSIFRHRSLDARLVSFDDEPSLIAALGSGGIDAATVNLPALLEPLESGADIRLTAGLHAGCLRVVAPEAVVLRTFGNLKGARVGTERLHGPSMNLLSALLRRQGIDPTRDISWHVCAHAELEAAFEAGSIDCAALPDPLGYALLAEKKAVPFVDTADGGFTCGDGIGRGHHCFLAVHGGLVRTRPAIAASLTHAYVAASTAVGRGVGPWALGEVRGSYVDADLYAAIGMLSSYDWSASTDAVLEEIELTARDFRRAGLLARRTDPERLANRAFADVTGG